MDSTRLSVFARLLRSPDAEGWAEFDGIYRPLLLRWLRGIHGLGDDADDVAQEVLLTVWRRVREFDHRDKGYEIWAEAIKPDIEMMLKD